MHEIALFVEDDAHERVVGALVRRVAEEQGVRVSINWRSTRGGHGRVAREFKQCLRGLERSDGSDTRSFLYRQSTLPVPSRC